MAVAAKTTSNSGTIPQTREILALAVAALSVILTAILFYRDSIAFGRVSEQLDLTQRIMLATTDLLSAIKDAETGQRGFLLTGRESYLDPYNRAVSVVPQILSRLTELTATRQDQARRVDTMKPLVREKLRELQKTIELHRLEGVNAALRAVLSDRGNILMDQIRQVCAEIETVANHRLAQQTEDARSAANRTRIIALAGSALIFCAAHHGRHRGPARDAA
jgi:CHASE3 domain sensor protein